MNVPRTLGLLARRAAPQKSLVRNAGVAHAHEHPELPPFPPGPRQMEQAKNWSSSAVLYGAFAFVTLCYFSDWKVITEYIPFYNGKYRKEEE